MRAVGVRGGGGNADALFIDDTVPDPVVKPGHILVGIKAFGLNRMDIMQREAKYPYALLPESGTIMGVEFSGMVIENGPNCTSNFKPGDRVFGLAYGGAYAEKISVSENMLMHMPPHMTFETVAGIPETYFTAIQALHLVGSLEKGQTVLIHAGASGVGQALIQVARHGGASKIWTTAGTDEKCALCRSLGADVVVNYRSQDFAEVIKKDTDGRGVDLIIDLVGRDYWHKNMASAAKDSKMVLVAAMSGNMIENFNLRDLLNKRIWVLATTLRTRDSTYQRKLRDKFIELAMNPLAQGDMKITVDKVYPWGQISDAHKRMEANVNAGKIICTSQKGKNPGGRPKRAEYRDPKVQPYLLKTRARALTLQEPGQQTSSLLLSLPPELRRRIYEDVLGHRKVHVVFEFGPQEYRTDIPKQSTYSTGPQPSTSPPASSYAASHH
ncbi:hypothetical protein B7463_g3228, partial [Scytalidium lignicola]